MILLRIIFLSESNCLLLDQSLSLSFSVCVFFQQFSTPTIEVDAVQQPKPPPAALVSGFSFGLYKKSNKMKTEWVVNLLKKLDPSELSASFLFVLVW